MVSVSHVYNRYVDDCLSRLIASGGVSFWSKN